MRRRRRLRRRTRLFLAPCKRRNCHQNRDRSPLPQNIPAAKTHHRLLNQTLPLALWEHVPHRTRSSSVCCAHLPECEPGGSQVVSTVEMKDTRDALSGTASHSFLGEKTVPDFRPSRNNPLVPRSLGPAPSTFSPAIAFSLPPQPPLR